MKIQTIRLFVVLIITGVLVGCANYQYDGVTYQTSDAAVNAARSDIAAGLTNVQKSTNPIGGRAKVVIPDRSLIERIGVIKQAMTPKDSIKYVVDVMEIGFLVLPDGIKKSELFDSITVVRLNNTKNPGIEGYDYLIWLYAIDINSWQWYVRTKNNEQKSPIHIDRGFHKHQRLKNMISSIEDSILKLGAVEIKRSDKTQGTDKSQQSNKKYVPWRKRKKN